MQRYKTNQGIFIILIPIFMLLIAFIFDFVLIFVQETRIEKTTKNIIESALTYTVTDYYKDAKETYENATISTELLEVKYEDSSLTIFNSCSYPSFFGKLIGINNYRFEIHLTGKKENDKIVFEEVQDE